MIKTEDFMENEGEGWKYTGICSETPDVGLAVGWCKVDRYVSLQHASKNGISA
jgi:hypothetical protein